MFQKFGKDIPQDLVDLVSGIMYEAKADEPAKPDAEAIARRKRLQAIKDKQEDDAAERGTGEKKSSAVRQVAGKAYGGAKQKDDKEDMEEAYGCDTKKEELIGGQKKLDKNHNGKLDADDFKKLRKEDTLEEKAVSIAQQKFMGMVNAVKKGKMKAPSAEVSKAASGMTKKAAHDYAATKHKGLPQHKEEVEQVDEVDLSTLNHLASHPMAGPAAAAAGAATGTAIAHGIKKVVDYVNKRKTVKQATKEEVEQVVEYKGQPSGVPFDADKPHAPVAKAGKSGYGASASKHLAKQGLKKFLKKEMLGKAPDNANEETEIEESRGHKILATKLRQLDTKLDKMSSGIAPDTHTNPQSTRDKIKDVANINSVEIVKQKDTSVKEDVEQMGETATLDQYIKSMGYDPEHMEKNKKVMFSKTNAFKAYAARSEGASPGQETDTGDSLNTNASARG
jgi:hypothetical protein